ncbi:hypothetical protein IEN85_18295 [Pelagicoccus sp. NFK12]|uniref:Uncharacterized protein n=1 Tax=Pelagicoccus enzymogenes TaxID=2773457 RepID=A0A927FAE5_9BACT|nr:hypothetical protein [Pelagicoccus enzymogenes]MBD5781457.1 hypothetical protein [Pelagicoccus enzymogenes]
MIRHQLQETATTIPQARHSAADFLFCTTILLTFSLPTNATTPIPLGPITFELREFGYLLLPTINLLSRRSFQSPQTGTCIRPIALAIISAIIGTELLKIIVYHSSLIDCVRSLRTPLPLLSCLLLFSTGLRISPQKTWKALSASVGISFLLSLIQFATGAKTPDILLPSDTTDIDYGRIVNANASFSIIALTALLYSAKKQYLLTLLSLATVALTFSRTYLATISLALIYAGMRTPTPNRLFKIALVVTTPTLVSIIAVTSSETIANQVERRIVSIIIQEQTIQGSAIDGNRDIIYNGILDKLKEGKWFIGLPFEEHIFEREEFNAVTKLRITDTSAANIVLLHGILPLTLYALLLGLLFSSSKSAEFRVALTLLTIASLNIDSLYRHNSVFFISAYYFYVKFKPSTRNAFCQKPAT